jgi:hypothetical protein
VGDLSFVGMELLFEKILSENSEIRIRSLKNLLFKLQNDLLDLSDGNIFLNQLYDKIMEYFFLLKNNQEFYHQQSFQYLCYVIHEVLLKYGNQLTQEKINKLSQELLRWKVSSSEDEELESLLTKV